MTLAKRIESATRRAALSLFSLFWRCGDASKIPVDGSKVKKVLILRPDKLGDMVITFPLIDALRRHYPHLKIYLLTSERNFPLVKDDPRIEKVYVYRKRFFRDIRTVQELRREVCDLVIDAVRNDSATTLFLAQLAVKNGTRISLGKVEHARFYDYNHPENPLRQEHNIDFTLKLLNAFGLDENEAERYAAPFIDSVSQSKADELLNQITGIRGKIWLVGYNASGGRPARRLPLESSLALLQSLLSEYSDLHILLLAAPDDYQLCKKLSEQLRQRAYLPPPGMNIVEVSALISRLSLLLSPDTSLIHIARSWRLPVIGFYTASERNFEHWHPYGQREGVVFSHNEYDIHDISLPEILGLFKQFRQTVVRGASN